MQQSWYAPLREIVSLGSRKGRIKHMGELAAQRREHLGQFFTPDHVAAFMWRIVAKHKFTSIYDNSIGSGRLVQFADPSVHSIYGVDVHEESVKQVQVVVENAGFTCKILHAGMEEVQVKAMDLSMLNPPFSVHLESPLLTYLPDCTRIGRYGPNTSAMSEEYALVQALQASKVVVALLPTTTAEEIAGRNWSGRNRLRAVFKLPRNTFSVEHANVATSIMVFGEHRYNYPVHQADVEDWEQEIPDLKLAHAFKETYSNAKPSLRQRKLDSSSPTITIPVTGDSRVGISLGGRNINLKFFCGFTEARVSNAILRKRIYSADGHRLPSGVLYAGQAMLDLEAHLVQDDPIQSFERLVDLIEANGGIAVVPAMVRQALKAHHKRSLRQRMPLSHTVWSRGAGSVDQVIGFAKKKHSVDPNRWLSPVLLAGEEVKFNRTSSGAFTFNKAGKEFSLTVDEIEERFTLQNVTEGWVDAHAGMHVAYPGISAQLHKRAVALGMDKWLSWDFQLRDTVELSMKPKGGIAAWKQSLGKSRLAAGLMILSGAKHSLLVLESRLLLEMREQLAKINIPDADINEIDCPEKLFKLSKFNLISYERLRMPLGTGSSITYAKRLRRRIGVLVADEGEKLANVHSDQSRALFDVSAKKKFILTGTPITGYPRDIHGLMLFVGGDCTATQPYGLRRGLLERWWVDDMRHAKRGIDGIRDEFSTFEWITQEFAESLATGAKREVPRIQNVEKFRSWLAPLMKRRLLEEPMVAAHIKMPPVFEETITLGWDSKHLGLYLKVADEFCQWYRDGSDEKRNNLAVLLAKLQAVQKALNCPQESDGDHIKFTGLTTKQVAVIDKLIEIAEAGEKSILFAENPATIKLLHRELANSGVDSIPFHGGISIKKRVDEKNKKFRQGEVPHLLATRATAKSGYNEPQADYVVNFDQSWSHRNMDQAMRRPLRPERKKPLKVINFVIEGSLDEYQAQMVAFKKDAAQAGLDWATPELDDVEFLHLGTILQRFMDDLAKMRGVRSHDLRETLKRAA